LRTFTGGTCCWEFWARGPGNRKESWAREPDRLFLAGWEVSQFWAELQLGAEFQNNISLRYLSSLLCCVIIVILFISLFIMLNMLFIIMLLINFNYVEHELLYVE
jgi:hypothetical protein